MKESNMQLFELLKWLSIFEEAMLVLISMFMIARYVFLEPSLEDKKQKNF